MKYLLYLVLPLIVMEVFLHYKVFSVQNENHSIRNNDFRRKWPEYTNICENGANHNTKKIVFIGNSQGFGRELDQDLIYTNQLQKLFYKNDRDIKVYNWCVPGAIGHELFILTAKAISSGFDHIIITMFVNNFAKDIICNPLSYSISDVPLILGEKAVYEIIPSDFLEKYSNSRGYYSYALERYVYISRFNKILKDYASKYTDNKETYWWRNAKTVVSENRKNELLGHVYDFDEHYFEYFDKLFTIAAAKGCKITLILTPLSEKLINKRDLPKLSKFSGFVMNHYKDTAIEVVDLVNALDENYYYSYTHFSPHNHMSLSDILFKWYVSKND